MSRKQRIVLVALGLVVVLVWCVLASYVFTNLGEDFSLQAWVPLQGAAGPTETPTETVLPAPMPLSNAVITERHLRVDEWQVYLFHVFTTPRGEPGRKNIHLIVDVTNIGEAESTFSGFTILLSDGQGRTYIEDIALSQSCVDTYGLESAAFLDANLTARTCVGYDTALDARSFTTSSLPVVSVWANGLAFEVP